jgi:hypothetical protein
LGIAEIMSEALFQYANRVRTRLANRLNGLGSGGDRAWIDALGEDSALALIEE